MYSKNIKLLNTLKRLIEQHISFVILITSSIAYYAFNLWLKYILNDYQYSEYSLLNSYLAITMTFALLGGDQLLLRISSVNNSTITIQKNILFFCITLLVIFSTISSYFLKYYYNVNVSMALLFMCSLLAGLTIITFSLFRLNSNYSLAQIQKNFWKITLLPCCALYYLWQNNLTLNSIISIVILSLITTLILSVKGVKNIPIILNNKKAINFELWIWIVISMIAMNLMTHADRFIIDKYIGLKEVGKYFTLQNIFLFPLTQIQNYSGFRELTIFKNNYSTLKLNESIKRNLILSSAISILIFTIAYTLHDILINIIDLKSNYLIVLLLILNGIIRITYSVVSAALGAVGKIQAIREINIISVIFISTFFCLLIKFRININTISIYFLTTWIFRTSITYVYLIKHEP